MADGSVAKRAGRLTTSAEAVIETASGKVLGVSRDGVPTFKGIPHGAAFRAAPQDGQ